MDSGLRQCGEGRYNGLTATGSAADEPRRLPVVDNRTRLHPPQHLLPSLILRHGQWRATERMVDAAVSVFGMKQLVRAR